MQRTVLAALCCALLSACASEPAATAAAAPAAANPAPERAAPSAAPAPVAETEAAKRARILATLSAKSIYFDYDNFSVKPEYMALLRQDYEMLKASPNLPVRLEGNGDERGSTEYNLALGQKRAEAVRHALELMGLPIAQVEAVSYGKEKPRATCHEEKCWAENRRVDFSDRKP